MASHHWFAVRTLEQERSTKVSQFNPFLYWYRNRKSGKDQSPTSVGVKARITTLLVLSMYSFNSLQTLLLALISSDAVNKYLQFSNRKAKWGLLSLLIWKENWSSFLMEFLLGSNKLIVLGFKGYILSLPNSKKLKNGQEEVKTNLGSKYWLYHW